MFWFTYKYGNTVMELQLLLNKLFILIILTYCVVSFAIVKVVRETIYLHGLIRDVIPILTR